MDTRECADCGSKFIPRPQKFRQQVFCDSCGSTLGRNRRHRQKVGLKPWIEKVCPACLTEFRTKYHIHHTCCSLKCRYYWGKLTHFYKLTPESYKVLLSRAKGCCEICGNAGTLNIDHDHNAEEMVVRGLLCRSCNNQLGLYERLTPERVQQIEMYLNRGRS